MAQSIILKRSATTGKVPTTSSLSVGELAINTYDGKVFLKKSGSSESIETIVTTDSLTTGSISLTGDLTVLGSINARQFNIGIISSSILYQSGSNKFGDTLDDTHQFTGSLIVTNGITGSIAATNGVISGSSQLTSSFDERYSLSGSGGAAGAGVFDFNLDPSAGTIGYISDTNSNYTLQATATSINMNGGATTFATITSGSATFGIPIIASISATNGVISGSSQLTSSYDSRYTLSGSIQLPSGIISGSSQLIAINASTASLNTFSGSQLSQNSNLATITGSLITSASNAVISITNLNAASSSYETKGRGIISGSSQITPLLPSGVVSGSGQVTLASTNGFGTYINQAVLSSSSPTFVNLTSTGYLRAQGIHLNSQTENRGHRVYSRTQDVNAYNSATSMRFTVAAGNNVQFQYEITFHATRLSGNQAETWYLRYTASTAYDTSGNPNERWWDLREQSGNGIAGVGRNNNSGNLEIYTSAYDTACRLTCVVAITCNNWDAVTVSFS